jgi:hypothetical protein
LRLGNPKMFKNDEIFKINFTRTVGSKYSLMVNSESLVNLFWYILKKIKNGQLK